MIVCILVSDNSRQIAIGAFRAPVAGRPSMITAALAEHRICKVRIGRKAGEPIVRGSRSRTPYAPARGQRASVQAAGSDPDVASPLQLLLASHRLRKHHAQMKSDVSGRRLPSCRPMRRGSRSADQVGQGKIFVVATRLPLLGGEHAPVRLTEEQPPLPRHAPGADYGRGTYR